MSKNNSRFLSLIAFFRVIRIANSCVVFLATFLGGFLSVRSEINAVPSLRQLGGLASASASLFFVAAFGYALNDYYDVRADSINRPSRPIPSGALSRTLVLEIAFACLVVAVLLALKWKLDSRAALMGLAALVWLYSAYAKKAGLAGNVLVSFLAGSALLFGGLYAGHPAPALFPALLAFLTNLPREILKDSQDVEGDCVQGKWSLASARGQTFASRLSSILVLVLVAVTFFPLATKVYNGYYFAIVFLCDAFLVWVSVSTWRAGGKAKVETSIRILKFVMPAGLLAVALGSV